MLHFYIPSILPSKNSSRTGSLVHFSSFFPVIRAANPTKPTLDCCSCICQSDVPGSFISSAKGCQKPADQLDFISFCSSSSRRTRFLIHFSIFFLLSFQRRMQISFLEKLLPARIISYPLIYHEL